MIIDCISDLHGFFPQLEGGDLLIVAGDLTARDDPFEYVEFAVWLHKQNYGKKITISGNHENLFEKWGFEKSQNRYKEIEVEYLCDSGTEFYYDDEEPEHRTKQPLKKLKIWGSPWTTSFDGMHDRCKAFTFEKEEQLALKWDLIPDDIDILITHSPPLNILDGVSGKGNVGSISLRNRIMSRLNNLKFHVFGHIHEWGGKVFETTLTKFVNASHVNEYYEPINKPVRILL